MTLVRLRSHRKGARTYIFDNGNEVSVIFGAGTYSELKDTEWETRTDTSSIESTDVEIMVWGNKSFEKWFERTFDGQNPAGYLSLTQMLDVLKKADSKVYKKK